MSVTTAPVATTSAPNVGMSTADTEQITVPDTVEELLGGEDARPERPWIVLVWNDPVNMMSYVDVRAARSCSGTRGRRRGD